MGSGVDTRLSATPAGRRGRDGAILATVDRLRTVTPAEWTVLIVVGLTVVGFALRMFELQQWMGLPVEPDAVEYKRLAVTMNNPLDTGAREPAWPVFLRVWMFVFGRADDQMRIASVLLSTALIPLCYVFGRLVSNARRIGVVTCALVALHPGLIEASVRGLRGELQTIALVGFAVGVLAAEMPARWRVALLMGGGGLVLNTNLGSLFAVPVGLVLVAVLGRLTLRQTLIAAAGVLLLIAPHLTRNAVVHDDPMYASNIHATWYRNSESCQQAATAAPTPPPTRPTHTQVAA